MVKKSIPQRSKIIITIVAFLATLYLLIVGFSYIKSWYDFRPYHKLAVELNSGLGGGFKESDMSSCNISTPDCPSVHMVKTQNITDIEASKFLEVKRSYLASNAYENLMEGSCDASENYGYCFVSGINKVSGLKVVLSEKLDALRIDIVSP